MSTPDLTVLALYLAGVVAAGCWFAKRSNSGTDAFMAAGRRLPGWVVGLSIFGTYVSSISFLANPGASYGSNWLPFAFSLSLPFAAWIATKYFVPFYRSTGEVSAYSHMEHRFGPWARAYLVFCYMLTQLARIGAILYLVAIAVEPLTGWDVRAIIVVTGVLVIAYTLLGGIEAVIWTDVVQSIVLTAGILLSLFVLLTGMPEGAGQVFQIAGEHHKFQLGEHGFHLVAASFVGVFLFGLFENLKNFGIDQSYVQRYATAKSGREARKSVWIGALTYIPVSALLFLVGTALFAFYHAQPDLLPVGTDADKVFPHFIKTQLPVGATGLLIAAVLAAAMSSVDSSLNSSATLYLCDIHKRFVDTATTEREGMRALRIATVVFGIVGVGSGLVFNSLGGSVLNNWWTISGILSGGMLGLFLLAMSSRAKNAGAVIGVCVGVAVIVWMATSKWMPEDFPLRYALNGKFIIVIGTLTIFGVGVGVSRLRRS